jgi:tetratricopeptide (TPR) repeat protein
MSEDRWDQIHEAHEKDQWATLLELCELHLKENPEHLHARIPQAIALTHLKHFDEAVSLLTRTFEDPNVSVTCKHQCQRQLGQTFEEMGRFDDARRAYEEAHRLDPKNTIPLIYRGAMELRLGKFVAAREWLTARLNVPRELSTKPTSTSPAHTCARATISKRSSIIKRRSRSIPTTTLRGNDWLMPSEHWRFASIQNKCRKIRFHPCNPWLRVSYVSSHQNTS